MDKVDRLDMVNIVDIQVLVLVNIFLRWTWTLWVWDPIEADMVNRVEIVDKVDVVDLEDEACLNRLLYLI